MGLELARATRLEPSAKLGIRVKRATGWTAESQVPIGVNATVPGDEIELSGNRQSSWMMVLHQWKGSEGIRSYHGMTRRRLMKTVNLMQASGGTSRGGLVKEPHNID